MEPVVAAVVIVLAPCQRTMGQQAAAAAAAAENIAASRVVEGTLDRRRTQKDHIFELGAVAAAMFSFDPVMPEQQALRANPSFHSYPMSEEQVLCCNRFGRIG